MSLDSGGRRGTAEPRPESRRSSARGRGQTRRGVRAGAPQCVPPSTARPGVTVRPRTSPRDLRWAAPLEASHAHFDVTVLPCLRGLFLLRLLLPPPPPPPPRRSCEPTHSPASSGSLSHFNCQHLLLSIPLVPLFAISFHVGSC